MNNSSHTRHVGAPRGPFVQDSQRDGANLFTDLCTCQIDLAKFTKATEYANSTSARVCLNGTKRKLSTYFANLTAEKKADKEVDKEAKKEDGATITPAPTAGKRKAADSSDGEDDFPISAAAKRQRKAAKKPATRKGKKQAALDAYSQEDNYDDYAAESD